ncbi:M24 family metallopeptidase [Actinomadura darangshiensis]|uniref:Xaa-Pro aminopeptidase n=1 Tax=Actinomadura darangshiensis TaxID=705336 RepID=A0A4R5BAA3_9ACTN|nr:aminopeptidase P family protein [Actinomadura darangshiensis]TDD83308.1 M24 family metallopeptidase [Actinomadura darangshiensis]
MDDRFTTGSHDLPVSDALASFMTRDWAAAEKPQSARQAVAPYADKRRAALSALFPGERLVLPAGPPKVRSNDCDYRYRPHTAYAHLTGDTGEDTGTGAVLMMEPTATGHDAVLHHRPRSPRDDGGFYRDRRNGEFWVGPRATLAETEARLGIECAPLDDLPKTLSGSRPTRVIRDVDPSVDRAVPVQDPRLDRELAACAAELRLVKDDWEIAQLQAAVDHTVQAFTAVAAALPQVTGLPRGERWVEGTFARVARIEGNGVGYETVAASGAHACVLHWIRNDGTLRLGDLLLLDAGVETGSLYTADITRTLPISGWFTPRQRQVYDLVYHAQEAGLAAIRPGSRFRDFHMAAMRVIAEGLEEWGVLRSAEEALDPESGAYRRYTLCSSGHMLGMDVHDCAAARASQYLDGELRPGHVLTVEPGLYLQPDDLTLPSQLRGIGVRIEDDIVVTANGAHLMSSELPRHPEEIELWMESLAG